jgi:hypothetical protein
MEDALKMIGWFVFYQKVVAGASTVLSENCWKTELPQNSMYR